MEFVIAHELPGRIRLRTPKGTFSKKNASAVEALWRIAAGREEGQGGLSDWEHPYIF